MSKKAILVRVDEKLYEEKIKKRLKEIDRSFNSYINQLIKKDLKKEGM